MNTLNSSRFIGLLHLFVFGLITLNAQIQKSGNLTSHIDSIINNMPNGEGANDYQHPNGTQLSTWGAVVDEMLAGSYADANTSASTINYRVVAFTDNSVFPNKVYYLFENNPGGTNYWGTYVLNPSPDRSKLMIQSPHSKKDFNTGKQGFYIFKQTGSKAFYFNGTNRCNSVDSTLCDGTTSVCSGSTAEAYKISDQAHTSDGALQKTTERMLNNNADMIFIQPHGFDKQVSDPDVIMSNGVQNDTPPNDYLSTLKTNLLVEDNTLTFKIAHIDTEWDRLNGTTNAQGRLVNGSADPCDIAATTNTGRFLHLEQAKVGLREFSSDWPKMSNAIAATFTADVLPVELVSFTGAVNESGILLKWATATEVNNYGFKIERLNPPLFPVHPLPGEELEGWESIAFVEGHGNSNSPKSYSYYDRDIDLALAGKFDKDKETAMRYRLMQIDLDGSYEYSDIIEVTISAQLETLELYPNYPNPFNPVTRISYTLPNDGNMSLKLFDILGNEMLRLENEFKQQGTYTIDVSANELPSSVYILSLQFENMTRTRKIVLIR